MGDCHCTLGFMRSQLFYENLDKYLGDHVEMKITKIGNHHYIRCVQVEILHKELSRISENTHITFAITKHGRINQAKYLLELGNSPFLKPPEQEIILTGQVGFFLRDRNAYPRIVFCWEE